jgi:uncharacterized cysteine cluster protein YcgN (CxxCxxCC family)
MTKESEFEEFYVALCERCGGCYFKLASPEDFSAVYAQCMMCGQVKDLTEE